MDYKGSLKVICGVLILGAALIASANTSPNVTTLTKSGVGSVLDNYFGETENDLFVTCYNYESSVINVFYSSNNRISWTGKEGSDGANDLPVAPVYSILNNPNEEDEVIIGTELGVQKTLHLTDANPDWNLVYEGMSDVAVFDMNFRETSALDNRVIAGAFGRGVYVSEFTSSTNPPVSTTDSITVIEGGMATTTTGGATSVLSNDNDPDGDLITMVLLSTTVNGVLTTSPSGTGSFTYIHNGSETTTDTFSYQASDGVLFGNTVLVTIIVTPFNDCPIVQNTMPDVTTSEDAVDKIIDFSAVFLDPEGSFLSYTVTHTNTPLLSASISTTSLTIDYTDNMVGSATVTITANDSGCGTLTEESFLVTVNAVNDLPIGVADTINVNEGGTVTLTTANATSVLFNDTDVEGSILTTGFLVGQPVPTLTPDLGTLSFLDNGTFSYTHDGTQIPAAGIATDTFFYKPFDGNSLGNTTTVTIQITHTNDCPIEAIPITDRSVMEDAADLEINIGSVFTDEELNTITLSVSNTNIPLLTATLNTVTLTIDFVDNMTGSSTIILYATDGVANCTTLVSSTFVITVNPQNDTPVGTPDTITVDEGGTATTTTGGANSVLSNDTDIESDPLTVTKLTDPQYHTGGIFTLQASGTFVYNHDGSETTTDTFTYRVSDSITTTDVLVTININPINDCPTIDIPLLDITVSEDAADRVINLSPNFSDAEGNPLSFSFTNDDPSIANITLNTSTLTIQYIPEQSGTTTVTISIDDSNGCNTVQDVFLVNIIAVNDPPVTVTDTLFVLEGGTVTQTTLTNSSLLTNDTDTESDALEAIQITPPANGTLALSSTGTFTYIHDGSETTTDSFQYRAAEIAPGGQVGNTITVSITIQEVNDCPIYTAVGGFPVANEDAPAWIWNYGAEISDPDGNTPIYGLTHTATDLLTAVTAANGIVTFTPKLNQSGSTTMTLNVNDGRGCDIDIEIPVVINPINDCPTLENPIPDVTASEDDPDFIIPLANIFADVDTTPLNYRTTIGNSSLIAVSITATALIIDFLPNQSGSTFINLIALDGDISCTVDDLFTVSITPVNDPPTGVGEVVNLAKGATSSVLNDGVTNSVLANDSDPESDAITAVIVTGPINGTIALLANGNFTYTHDNSTTATDSFTYTPRDAFLNIGNTTTVTIYINNVPVGVTETIALIEGGTAATTTAASTSVLSNDTDADFGDTALLTATIGTSPLFGTLVLNADGSFIYSHLGSEDFTDSFTYIPFDGKGYGIPTVVSVTITPTNDAPVAFPDSITVGVGQTTSLLTGGINSVLLNDTDPDGDPLTAVLVTGTSSGTLVLNPGGTFSYTQSGVMDAGDSFTYKANDGLLDSNIVTVNITLTCSPCTEKTIEAGSSGVIISYRGCDCRKYDAYVPKGEVYIFCHLDGSVVIGSGSYTVLSSKVCY
ncbi:MAG: Ig-like domain-containing protein [Flavobacteriales bacterium]